MLGLLALFTLFEATSLGALYGVTDMGGGLSVAAHWSIDSRVVVMSGIHANDIYCSQARPDMTRRSYATKPYPRQHRPTD